MCGTPDAVYFENDVVHLAGFREAEGYLFPQRGSGKGQVPEVLEEANREKENDRGSSTEKNRTLSLIEGRKDIWMKTASEMI